MVPFNFIKTVKTSLQGVFDAKKVQKIVLQTVSKKPHDHGAPEKIRRRRESQRRKLKAQTQRRMADDRQF